MEVFIKYVIFAIVAISLNITTQWIVLTFYKSHYSLYFAMLLGTIVGLIVKYILDKKFIFYFKTKRISDNIIKFVTYSIFGGFTTIIFWGVEIGFHFIFKHESAKYIGAVIGLSIGYYLKYILDKKFVFGRTFYEFY